MVDSNWCVTQASALARTLGANAVLVQGHCAVNTSLMQPVHDELQQVGG